MPPLSRFIQYYALMQGVQREYLTDTVAAIHYHNGVEFLPTSRALAEDSQKSGRIRVRYSRGLTVHVNYNAEKSWSVESGGRRYELPPFGWLIEKPDSILAYSALVSGKRRAGVDQHRGITGQFGGGRDPLHVGAQVRQFLFEGAVSAGQQGGALQWRRRAHGVLQQALQQQPAHG